MTNLIKGKANEIDLDPALKKVMDLRQWFENIVEDVEVVADKVKEVVEEVVEKVEGSDKVKEVVDEIVEKVEGSDKVGEVVDKVDDVVTKVERVVDNFNEIIQMKEAPKVEGK